MDMFSTACGFYRFTNSLPIGRRKGLIVRHRHATSLQACRTESSRAVCSVGRGDFLLGSIVVGHVQRPAPNASGSIGHDDLLVHSRVCSRLRLANQGGVQQKRGVGFPLSLDL